MNLPFTCDGRSLNPDHRELIIKNLGPNNQVGEYNGIGPTIQTLSLVFESAGERKMKYGTILPGIFLLATMTGCATLFPPDVAVGEPEANVIAKRGEPTHRYRVGNEQLLEYATGPWGQKTWMARIGPDGKVTSFEQVLSMQKFAAIKVGESTKNEVLHTIGTPSETSYLSLSDLEVWTYPYKENDVWNSLMHVHFDKSGVVRKMMNGPDPSRDPDLRFPMGMMRR
jgi:hypothetical protein